MKTSLLMDFSVDKENKKIEVKRAFAAPLSKVWAAWTESQLLDQWWAPKPWLAQTKSMNFKEGGYWLYAMVSPEGDKHWSRKDYQKIIPSESFSSKDSFCDEAGHLKADFPSSNWQTNFSESADGTQVNITLSYDQVADLEKMIAMGFKEGLSMALTNLDQLLA